MAASRSGCGTSFSRAGTRSAMHCSIRSPLSASVALILPPASSSTVAAGRYSLSITTAAFVPFRRTMSGFPVGRSAPCCSAAILAGHSGFIVQSTRHSASLNVGSLFLGVMGCAVSGFSGTASGRSRCRH